MRAAPAFDFSGKCALVTGGSRGIGAAIARALGGCGAHVFLNYRQDEAGALATAREIESAGGTAAGIRANLINPEEIQEMFRKIFEEGGLDFLVHSAALGSFKPLLEVRANQWDLSLSINARAYLLCAQEAAKGMTAGGRIVGLSSLGSSRVVPAYGAIGVSKAALEAVTRSLAVELGSRGITVNAIAAGLIESPTIRRHPGSERLIERTLDQTPAGRLGAPEDVAKVVLFLCSSLSDWISGQTLVVDGGMSLRL